MGKGKKKMTIKKELIAEDWCFVCKDGGDMRICDYKQCLKSYHPHCLGKDGSFLISKRRWNCSWHTCSFCNKYVSHSCYTCTYAVCCRCIADAAFLQVKEAKGFCHDCLKLVLLIEEAKNYDSDGERVDFTDRNSIEGLFMEYYMIVKKVEGFELAEIHAAQDRANAAQNRAKMERDIQFGSRSEEFFESDEEQVSDYECMESQMKRRKMQKGKKSKRHAHLKSNKMEFIGWGSKPLIDFLSSIGKSIAEKISQHDVTSIVNEYINENKLSHPNKRKWVECDAILQSIFKKKKINKSRVFDLLESHFVENQDDSEEDELGSDSNDSTIDTSQSKSRKKFDMENISQKKELTNGVPHICFASIVVENIKLVYLKKCLLYELVKEPESFEEKVIGSFVLVKSDPFDYCARNSHQLMQVTGIKPAYNGENSEEIVLLFPTMPRESRISLLSDANISEVECDELKQKMLAGLLKRPTVVELEQKAKILHRDLTKHWISKQLSSLKNRSDNANEKGWRREYFELLEKWETLKTPSEQARLLATVPTVIPDVSDLNPHSEDKIDDMEREEYSPKSILQCNSSVSGDGWQKKRTSEEKTDHGCAPHPEKQATKAADVIELLSDDDNVSFDDVASQNWCILGPHGERNTCSLSVLKQWSQMIPSAFEFKVWKEDQEEEDAIWLREALNSAFPKK